MYQRPFSTMAKNFAFTSLIRESLSELAAGRREAVVPATYRYIHVGTCRVPVPVPVYLTLPYITTS